MVKKLIWCILGVVLLTCIQNSPAEEETNPPQTPPARRPTTGRTTQRFSNFMDQLNEAYEQKDWDKIGLTIEQMKEARERFRRRPDSEGTRDRRDERPRPDRERRTGQTSEQSPVAKDDAEKKILTVLDDMNDNQRRRMMNVPPEDGRVLRLLTESVGAKNVVEIGTSNGYSGIWFCLALRKTNGKLITYEINAERAQLARENFKLAGVDKLITLIEGDAHEEVKKLKDPIDILFLDADKEGYIDYLNKLLPLLRPGGLILAHNTTNTGRQMQDYLNAVTTNPDLETIFLHEQSSGIGVTLKKR
jgi:caffeoyl-CoA O-methyltransferase